MTMHIPPTKAFVASTLALTLVLEGAVARAQDNTGADRPTTAPAMEPSEAKANGVYPAPALGVEHGVPASKGAKTTRTTHSSTHQPHHAKQPIKGSAHTSAEPGGSDARE